MVTARDIGQRIRKARQALGMSQDDLARAVGVRMQSIYRYEKEGMDLKSTVAVRIARTLNVSLPWLLTGAEIAPPPPAFQEFLSASPLGRTAGELEKQILQSLQFPPEIEPTRALYEKLLIDLRSEAKTERK